MRGGLGEEERPGGEGNPTGAFLVPFKGSG